MLCVSKNYLSGTYIFVTWIRPKRNCGFLIKNDQANKNEFYNCLLSTTYFRIQKGCFEIVVWVITGGN